MRLRNGRPKPTPRGFSSASKASCSKLLSIEDARYKINFHNQGFIFWSLHEENCFYPELGLLCHRERICSSTCGPRANTRAAKIKVAFSRYDVRGQEVTLKSKWFFSTCGSGDQVVRIVYSPQLDFVVERDTKSFAPNGILNSGNLTKVTAVN
jgi:hypothetical protein